LGAEDRLVELEYQIFVDVRNKVAKEINRLKTTARSLARIDVLCSLAEVADRESYTMPEVTDDDKIEIKDGRHPVVEKIIGQEAFVPNDTYLTWMKTNCYNYRA